MAATSSCRPTAASILPDAEVGLLLGISCRRVPKAVVTGEEDDPWAVRTELGLSVVGAMKSGTSEDSSCYLVDTGGGSSTLRQYSFRTQVKEITPEQVARLFDEDFEETSDLKTDSKRFHENVRFQKLIEEKLVKREDGHFVGPLPLKNQIVNFVTNRPPTLPR